MTELQWRRKWKPDLNACSWQSLNVDAHETSVLAKNILFKAKFSENEYEFLVTDMVDFWYEILDEDDVKKRIRKLNPSIEAPITKILDQVKDNLEHPSKETQLSVKKHEKALHVKIISNLAGMPFTWTFNACLTSHEMGRDHMTIPLMAMVGELYRQQQELFKILAAKDKQIDDYKSQGVHTTRKHIETAPFDQLAFRNSMTTSKGFEDEVRNIHGKAFTSLGQDLYKQIATKRAWLMSSPIKDVEGSDDSIEHVTTGRDDPSVESWASRFPASLANQTVSPTKRSMPSPTKSPAKSPASSTSSNSSPVKDTELMRRQALERKLEQEEAKQDKGKKKKKLKF